MADLLVVGLAFFVATVGLTAYSTFRIWQVGQQDGRRHVDAIVVLGAAQYQGKPSATLAARLDHAVALYDEGYADYFFTTGGNMPGDISTEAETGRSYAMIHGVPASAILMETTGGTTLESLRNVKAIFDARGLHTALFVSDRSHMLRVLRMAQDLGIEAWASPTDTSPDDLDPNLARKSLLHELGAMAQYVFLASEESPDDGANSPPSPVPSSAAAQP